jgi:misacylated tRNA(Ala) deacylase
MTELLYQTDSYLQEFDAKVTSVHPAERAVVLDRTSFYPAVDDSPATLER